MDEWVDGLTNRWEDGWMKDGRTVGKDEWVFKWMNEWLG